MCKGVNFVQLDRQFLFITENIIMNMNNLNTQLCTYVIDYLDVMVINFEYGFF